MAKVINNVITRGLQGMLGKQLVFRQRNGKTFVYSRPQNRKTQSDAQLAQINLFREAVAYAKAAMKDEEKKKYYARISKRGTPAYNTAIADFMNHLRTKKVDDSSSSEKQVRNSG